MSFSIDCCCNRKTTKRREMSELKKDDNVNYADGLSDIYELVLTPCDNSPQMPEVTQNTLTLPPLEKRRVYVNFFEDTGVPIPDSPITPRTPDANLNTLNLMIPKGSELYVNYEKVNNFT